MLDKLFRILFDFLLKEFFVLKAEGGDLDADPVAKDFEVLKYFFAIVAEPTSTTLT